MFDKLIEAYGKKNLTKVDNPVYADVCRVEENGVVARHITLDTALEKPYTIAMITDAHIKTWNGNTIDAMRRVMPVAGLADLIVCDGDTVESVNDRVHIDYLRNFVWEPYPSAICVMGNHEQFYGDAVQNRAFVDEIWPHDTRYYSRLVADNLLIVTMDDNLALFSDEQCDRFEADLRLAREKHYMVLVFIHIALASVNKETEADQRMASLVCDNGDLIAAMFSGHHHVDAHDELPARHQTPDGAWVDTTIPCYKVAANAEGEGHGNLLFITCK